VLQQIWFSGVHSNVGGGYPETGLSDLALRWMIEKAKACGLSFDDQYLKEKLKPNPLDKITDSMTPYYRAFGRYARPIGESDKSETMALTALERSQALKDYTPVNLEKYLANGGNVTHVVTARPVPPFSHA
jgi:hypothetical protein